MSLFGIRLCVYVLRACPPPHQRPIAVAHLLPLLQYTSLQFQDVACFARHSSLKAGCFVFRGVFGHRGRGWVHNYVCRGGVRHTHSKRGETARERATILPTRLSTAHRTFQSILSGKDGTPDSLQSAAPRSALFNCHQRLSLSITHRRPFGALSLYNIISTLGLVCF